MESEVNEDFQDYWNEYRTTHSDDEKLLDDQKVLDSEGIDEAEWLILAGLPHLTDVFLKGQLIDDSEVESVVGDVLSVAQANAVRKRVNSLNQTIRHRARTKNKKPDIRDVFKHVLNSNEESLIVSESDSKTPGGISDKSIALLPSITNHQGCKNDHRFVEVSGDAIELGLSTKSVGKPAAYSCFFPQHEIFRRTARTEGDIVASTNADGIRMLAFQKLGTLREPPSAKWYHERSDQPSSLPSFIEQTSYTENALSTSMDKDKLLPLTTCDDNSIGFERMWQFPSHTQKQQEQNVLKDTEVIDEQELKTGRTWIDTLADEDVDKIKPLLFVELSALFDRACIPLPKIKRRKFKKKHDGNVFGVSLSELMERDVSIVLRDQSTPRIPIIFTKILEEIERRGINEEGILRVAGNKLKVDNLINEIEKHFCDFQRISQILQRSSVHDLTTLLKKLLRDLPEPLLTTQLIQLFYQSHRLSEFEKALNLLILLLPSENRITLLAIINFARRVSQHEHTNKMSSHNVAMIIAPSIFPPRYTQMGKSRGDLRAEVELAAVSCRITEALMKCADRLNVVPFPLICQLRRMNELNQYAAAISSPLIENVNLKQKNKAIACKNRLMRRDGQLAMTEIVLINAPQFDLENYPIEVNELTTVGDMVLRSVETGTNTRHSIVGKVNLHKMKRPRDIKQQRVLTELAPNGNLSCLLSTADPDTALDTHFLYECGGNISQRRIEPSAIMLGVYQQNPNARWIIQCDHRNALRRTSDLIR